MLPAFFDRRVKCAVNPVTANEAERHAVETTAAATKKRVVVVGGGPSGLEAARVAALRGHDVTLFEKGPKLGGTPSRRTKRYAGNAGAVGGSRRAYKDQVLVLEAKGSVVRGRGRSGSDASGRKKKKRKSKLGKDSIAIDVIDGGDTANGDNGHDDDVSAVSTVDGIEYVSRKLGERSEAMRTAIPPGRPAFAKRKREPQGPQRPVAGVGVRARGAREPP